MLQPWTWLLYQVGFCMFEHTWTTPVDSPSCKQYVETWLNNTIILPIMLTVLLQGCRANNLVIACDITGWYYRMILQGDIYACNLRTILLLSNRDLEQLAFLVHVGQPEISSIHFWIANSVSLTLCLPGVCLPEVCLPEICLPAICLPWVCLPGVCLPEICLPGVCLPGVCLLGVCLPGVYLPGVCLPGVCLPGGYLPEVCLPGVCLPGVCLPGVCLPGVCLPEVCLPGFVYQVFVYQGFVYQGFPSAEWNRLALARRKL